MTTSNSYLGIEIKRHFFRRVYNRRATSFSYLIWASSCNKALFFLVKNSYLDLTETKRKLCGNPERTNTSRGQHKPHSRIQSLFSATLFKVSDIIFWPRNLQIKLIYLTHCTIKRIKKLDYLGRTEAERKVCGKSRKSKCRSVLLTEILYWHVMCLVWQLFSVKNRYLSVARDDLDLF